jgi:hypothetical protein
MGVGIRPAKPGDEWAPRQGESTYLRAAVGTVSRHAQVETMMSSIFWLGLAVLLVTAVALTGAGPKGGKPVARTRLMGMARYVLIVGVVVCGVLGVFGAIRH